MKSEVLLALISKMVEEKFKELPSLHSGPRGFRGPPGQDGINGQDGRDFVFSEHKETIRNWVKDFALKFEDFTGEQIKSITGPKGRDGRDGRNGRDFNWEEHQSAIESLVEKFVPKFEDFSEAQKEELRGEKGEAGSGFVFEDHKASIQSLIEQEIQEIQESLKLKFSDLSYEELNQIRGPRGQRGRPGKDFVFEDHKEYFDSLRMKFADLSAEEKLELTLKFSHLSEEERDSLKLKFADLSIDEKMELKGPRGQRGKPGRDGQAGENGKDGLSIRGLPGAMGPRGFQGAPGLSGLDGADGKDAPYIVDIDVDQTKNDFVLVFKFSDGSVLETPSINIPDKIKEMWIVGGGAYAASGGGGGGSGADGKSAYEVAVDNGFVGDEAAWLASLVGPPGADGADGVAGADGKSAYEVAVENGFVGDGTAWLASLEGPPGADGIDGTSTEYFDEGVSLGQALELDFVGPGVSATKVGDRITVSVSAGPGNDVLYSVPCETDVYVGALVKLDALSPVDIFIDDWMTLLNVVTMSSNTYSVIASNALADSMQNSNVIGVVQAKPTASTCDIRIYGETPDLFLGLDLSKEYYLSDTYPGSMVVYESRPFESGSIVLKVGQAASGQSFIFDRGERGFTSGTPTVNAPGYPDYSEKLEAFLNILAAHDIIASVDYLDDGIRTMRIGQVAYQSNLYPESEITKSISYADVGLMNQRITQIDFTGGAFGSATLSKIFEYVPSGIKQKLDGFYYELN